MRKLSVALIIIALAGCQSKKTETSGADSVAVGDPGKEEKTERCVFRNYIVGDCVHIEFSCGDFGAAKREQLDEASQTLWTSLSIEDSTGYEVPNPKYVGREFEIRYNYTTGYECQDPTEAKIAQKVPNLLAVKLVE